jgi:hypothetical protein
MNYYKSLFILLFAGLFVQCQMITHCNDKETFIQNYEKFTEDLKTHHRDLQKSDWTAIDREFEMYVDECYPKFKAELSLSEKVTFWKSTLAYTAYRGKGEMDIDIKINDLKIELSNEMNDLSIESKKELEIFIKEELRPELEEAIDEVVETIKEVGDELKSWLKR